MPSEKGASPRRRSGRTGESFSHGDCGLPLPAGVLSVHYNSGLRDDRDVLRQRSENQTVTAAKGGLSVRRVREKGLILSNIRSESLGGRPPSQA